MCNPLAGIKPLFDYGLNCLLLKVNALVDLDPAIVCLLFHPCKKMALVSIDFLAFCGIEQFPDIR